MNSSEPDFARVCRLSELSEKKGRAFMVGDVEIALFKLNDTVYALSNVCPHLHMSIIHDSFIGQDYITCPAHGWQFNLETGKQPDGRRGLDRYDVEIRGDEVFVKVIKRKFLF